MANTIKLLVLLLFSFAIGDGARTKFPTTLQTSTGIDGICKSMVETQGYICEEHKVTTKDGYILSMQRMPKGRSASEKGVKPPVLLQHGLTMDATTWLLNSPAESLAFILADNGYDVWLGNTRGTYQSQGHTSLNPYDPAYWNWSWDELVAYDLPANFQYVYDQTGQKLHYVGHSLGTLMALGAFSRKEVLNMIRSAALLSPIAYMGQMPSLLARSAADLFLSEDLYWLGLKEISLGGEATSKLVDDICKAPNINCTDLIAPFTGPNCCINTSNSYLDHVQPTATKNIIHLSQMIRGGSIAMYDYGSAFQNYIYYSQPTPPLYDMESIPNDLPLFLSYGGKDLLSDVKDVQNLVEKLKGHDPNKLVVQFKEDYAHLDFVFGVNAKQNPVTTKDGYILSMQRMPKGRSASEKGVKPPVLLQHGLTMDATTWLLNSPAESLAFILADNGYDVWLGNTRGTYQSQGHTSLNPYDPAYWNWSWDELVAYDLPANFQYVYDQTGQKLHYVGHSLGTLMALGAFSRKEVLNMIRSAALLSPIAYMGQMPSLLARSAADLFLSEDLYWLGLKEISLGGEATSKLVDDICKAPSINCTDLIAPFTVIRGGSIAMYDYGSAFQNYIYYSQPTPPLYDMESIPNDLPLFLSYGGKDLLSDVKDVQNLVEKLKGHDPNKLVVQFKEDYAHLDFVFGVNAKQA
ncbi:Triacylglycerol lipase 2 [Forsythia ovata]|uniref:Triacylglycerol lipase 2 n=1 Tax=Forsythia ovata TaxID=205694 RepID=A0ABD1VKZ6_9LAMI